MRSRRRPTVALFLLSTFALAVCDVATASRPRLISRDPPGAHGFAGWSRQASILWYSGGGSGWHVGGFHVAGFSGDTNRLVILDATALRLWDTDTAQVTKVIAVDVPTAGWPWLSGDGRRLVTSGPGGMQVLDATTGEGWGSFPRASRVQTASR